MFISGFSNEKLKLREIMKLAQGHSKEPGFNSILPDSKFTPFLLLCNTVVENRASEASLSGFELSATTL